MNCGSCGRANRAGARFCGGCGRPLAARCPACGAEAEANAQFCDACGASLVPRSEPADDSGARKVVTIVFADLVGSTALHERLDAESTRRLMDRYHRSMSAAVEAYGGTVVQLLGDGVLAAFGVPRVAEDDAIRAVRAAVAMQRAFRELASEQAEVVGNAGLRVAVNTGEVVVPDDHTGVIGDPVNVAARLQQEAREGDVLIGESTRRLVNDLVTLAPFGTFALKGRSETVAAYRVVSLERPAGASAIAFVGRDDELRRITAIYDAAVAAPAGRLVVILGSPGLGKSRLIEEFARRLGDGATLLAAHCDSAGGTTFAPLARALRTLLGIDDGTSGDNLRAAIDNAVPGDDSDRARIAGGIAALLAGTPASSEETFFVVRRLLAVLAAARPVVFAIDDLQWAEPLLLDLVEHLVQWSTGVPLLVVGAARPELRDTRSSLATPGGGVADVVTLAGLDAGAATRLAANVIGADALPAAVAGRVLAASEGNPLFLGELVRMLVNDGALKREGDRWTAGAELAGLEMPPTIHALLAARIERLRPEERMVLERAAVVGRQFSRAAVAHLLPREAQADLDTRLESLRRSELIEPDAAWFLGEPSLRFHHGLIRDAAYRRVLKGTRAELHGRFADWIETRVGEAVEHDETMGWHLEQAHQHLRELGPIDEHGRALGERAARHLAAAGRRALARDDVPLAASLLGRALGRLDTDDPTRADLVLDWCEALLGAGDVGPAGKAIAELGRIAGDSDRLRAWHVCFAGQLAVLTDPKTLRATADALATAAEQLASAGDTAGEAKAHSVHALALGRLGKVGACEAALDRALAAARRAHDRRRSNAVLAGAPVAALWGPSPVTRASGRCLDVVRVLRITQGAPAVEAVALRCQAVLEALRGRIDAARRMIASSRRMVEELGITHRLLEADVFAGLIDLLDGDAPAAERSLRPAYEGLRDLGLGIDAAQAAAYLGRALLAQGRAAEAEALTEESEALAGDDLQAAIAWRGVRAEALARRGEHAAAVDFARAAVEIAAGTDALLHHANARMALATALRAAGQVSEADTEERRAIELWEAKGATLLAERARRDAGRTVQAERAPIEPPAPARPVRRRVRANAATANAARVDAAIAARDADALLTVFSAYAEMVHHPTGAVYDQHGALSNWRALLDATNVRFATDPLATLGDSLALCHAHASFGALVGDDVAPFGAVAKDEFILIEVDARGQRRRAEFFANNRLGDAVARFYERYADLLPDGPERIRAAATTRSVATLLEPLDPDRFRTALAPAVEFVDHRPLGLGLGRGAETMVRVLRSLFEVAADVALCDNDVLELRPDLLLVRRTTSGTDRAGGGAFERSFLNLWVFGADGLLSRLEWFPVDHEAEALARVDELAAEPPARRVRANAATEHASRLDAAAAARDFDAFQSLLADDAQGVHHPTGTTYEERRALPSYRALLQTADLTFTHQPLATLGDSLALCRTSLSFSEGSPESPIGPFGATASDSILLIEVDAAGRRRRSEFFATERLADAGARLYERYAELLPDGSARTRAAATARSVAAHLRPFEIDSFGAVVAPEIEVLDHRTAGLPPMRGVEAVSRGLAAAFEVGDEMVDHLDDVVVAQPNAFLVRWTTSGRARVGGGSFEWPYLLLCIFGAEGRAIRFEVFAVDRDREALARFDELTAAPTAAPRRVRPNAATANAARLDAAIATRDLDAALDLLADDMEGVHHPTGVTYDREGARFSFRTLLGARDLGFEHEPLATLGDTLALFRCRTSFSELASDDLAFGAVERESLILFELDSTGRQRRVEFFAADRLGDALTRLYELYAALLPDGPARARAAATAPSVAAMLGRADLDRWSAVFAPDIEFVDSRTVGFGSMRGAGTVIEGVRTLIDLTNDFGTRIDDVIGARPDALLVRWTNLGTLRAGGGGFERDLWELWLFGADGRLGRWEQFAADRVSEALARFEELTTETPAAQRRVRPNAATADGARLEAAVAARDADALVPLFADLVEFVDHATGAVYDGRGMLAAWRSLLRAQDPRIRNEWLATLGDSLALGRGSMSFRALAEDADAPFGAVEREELVLIEMGSSGHQQRVETFAPDHLGDAVARLYERYAELLPDGPERVRAAATARSAAAMLGPPDLDRLATVFAPAIEFADHRTLGLGSARGAEAVLRGFAATVEASGDMVGRLDEILVVQSNAFLVRCKTSGTARVGGGAFEWQFLPLCIFGADGLATRYELFAVDQEREALARLDELAAEQPVARSANVSSRVAERHGRRVRANAATAHAADMSAAMAAQDADAIASLHAEGVEFVHHQTGVTYGLELELPALRELIRLQPLAFRFEPLATLGDSLALCRHSLSGAGAAVGNLDVGAWEGEQIVLIEVDAQGRGRRIEFFATDRLGDAVARLCERYAELLPDGPARIRAAATARSVAALLGPFDVARYATGIAPALDCADHRRVGLESSRGAEAWLHAFGSLAELADEIANHVDDVVGLRSNVLLVTMVNSGRQRVGGGAYERHFLWLGVFGPDGLLARIEYFDVEREADALARFDELAIEPPAARFANAAWRAVERMERGWSERDWEGMIASFIPTLVMDDRRALVHLQVSGEEFLANQRFLFAMKSSRWQSDLLATRGERLALCRTRFTGEAGDGGHILVEVLSLVQVDAADRYVALVLFDLDDLDAAYAELDARYAAGEAAPYAHTWGTVRRCIRGITDRDWDAVVALLAPDMVTDDHRPVRWGTLHSRDEWLARNVALVELAPDVRMRLDHVLGLGERGGIGAAHWIGSREGGSFEIPAFLVMAFGPDGRIGRWDLYDPDQLDAALARYDELTLAAPTPARITNAATRWLDRFKEASEARDLERLAALHAPSFQHFDRRTLVRLESDRDQTLGTLQRLSERRSSRYTWKLLATRGDRLALARALSELSDDDVGPSEFEWLTIVEVDKAGGRVAGVLFDPDALEAAYAELDLRYAAGEGAPYAIRETMQRFVQLVAARDWRRLASVLSPDFVVEDHRPIGWGTLHSGDDYVARLRALVELRSDSTLRVDHVLACDERSGVIVVRWSGSEVIGAFEIVAVAVAVLDIDGRIRRLHFYDLDQLDDARACYDALRSEPPTRRIENAATRSFDRFYDAWEARDWERVAAVLAPGFRMIDRRTLMHMELDRDTHLRSQRIVFEMSSSRYSSKVIATRGDRLALARGRFDGTDRSVGPMESEFLFVVEVDEHGDRVVLVMLDPDAIDAAYAELDARYHVGEATPHARVAASMRAFHRAFASRNWTALAAQCAPDLVVHDHRLLGWETLHGPAAYVEALRSLVELAPDTKLRLDHVTMSEHGYLVITVWEGTREGGAYEAPSLMVAELDGQARIRRFDQYDLDRLDEARARYAELTTGQPAPRIENAATRSMTELRDAMGAGDWERVGAVFAPDYRVFDRRSMMQLDLDRAGQLESLRIVAKMSSFRITREVLATRGDRLALEKVLFEGTDRSIGPSAIEYLSIVEVNDAGIRVAMVLLDPNDLDGAYAELDLRYAAGEAASHPLSAAARRSFERAFAARDWDALTSQFAPDFVLDDHRPLGWEPIRGPAAYVATLRSLVELAPDARLRIDHLVLCAQGRLTVATWLGTREGGSFEAPRIGVVELDGLGRVRRNDIYDLEQLDEARARFAALAAGADRDPLAAFAKPNAASAAMDRVQAAFEARDWPAMRAVCAPDAKIDDRRRHVLLTLDADAWVEDSQRMVQDANVRYQRRLVSTAGDRVVLERVVWTGQSGGGPFEVEYLALTQVDERGLIIAAVAFDPGDWRAAHREAGMRWLAHEPAIADSHRPLFEFSEATNDHDRARIRAVLADDLVMDDHLRTGPGRLDGADAYLDWIAGWFELAPDLQLTTLFSLARDAHGGVGVLRFAGTVPGGGAFETLRITVTIVERGLITRLEIFEIEDADAALARFAELRPDPLRIPPNAATRAGDRHMEALQAGDMEALSLLCAPTMIFDDRRRGVLVCGDRDMFIASSRLTRAAGQSRTRLATAGDRLSLEHLRWSGNFDGGDFESENLSIHEVDAEGRTIAVIAFEPEDRRAASIEMFDRYFRGEGARFTPQSQVELVRALNDHDLGRVRAALPDDFYFHDRRRTGVGRLESADAYVSSLPPLFEQAPDLTTDTLYHVAVEEHGSLTVGRLFGTLAGGGAFESVFVRLILYRGGRAVGTEVFEPEDLELAKARFAELRPDPLRIPPNAATRAIERFWECIERRDWEALRALCTPIAWEDRRRLIRTTGDCDTVLANAKLISRAGTRASRTVLATAGDQLVLQRLSLRGPPEGPAFETEILEVIEVDAEGRVVALIDFDADDRRAASAELFERRVRSDVGRWTPPSLVEFRRARSDHDLERMRAALPDDFFFHDHRRTGAGRLGNAEDYVAWIAAMWELSPDATIGEPLYYVAEEKHGFLAIARNVGTLAGGGEFESVFVQLVLYPGGRPAGGELFELEDLDAARTRLDELRPDPLRIPPNAATRLRDHIDEAFVAEDWAALRALVSADFVFDERRRGALVRGDVELWIKNMEVVRSSPGARFTRERIGTVGDRVALERVVLAGEPDTGRFEIEFILLTEIGADASLAASTTFDVDDRTAAFAEAQARFVAGEALAIGGQAPIAALIHALGHHDWEALSGSLADDASICDRRALAIMGEFDREQWVESLQTLADLAPDMDWELFRILAWNRHGRVGLTRLYGTTRDGGPFENAIVAVLLSRGDRVQRYEFFDVGDADQALARFRELCAEVE